MLYTYVLMGVLMRYSLEDCQSQSSSTEQLCSMVTQQSSKHLVSSPTCFRVFNLFKIHRPDGCFGRGSSNSGVLSSVFTRPWPWWFDSSADSICTQHFKDPRIAATAVTTELIQTGDYYRPYYPYEKRKRKIYFYHVYVCVIVVHCLIYSVLYLVTIFLSLCTNVGMW